MTIKRLDPVQDAIVRQGVQGRIRVQDVLQYYDRSEYVTADGLNAVLKDVDNKLAAKGIDAVARRSSQNIIFELAFNSLIHGPGSSPLSELLVLAVHRQQVDIWMFGGGHSKQVSRLQKIINSVNASAQPPHHREELLARRNARAWRERALPSSRKRGAGLGMLTIAALSREPLFFVPYQHGANTSFALQSVV